MKIIKKGPKKPKKGTIVKSAPKVVGYKKGGVVRGGGAAKAGLGYDNS